jgi:hypothetical protein
MPAYPAPDESFARLRRSGWSVGEAPFCGNGRLVWQVDGVNGENQVRDQGDSQAEAWHRACQQAEVLGILRG